MSTDKLKRYLLFTIGLFINAFGVSLITKASLGTSPISSIPYVLSLNMPFTLGEFTILFNLLIMGAQLAILRRKFTAEHCLQIPVTILFGYFIDVTMVLLQFVQPQTYFTEILYLMAGCLILGFGVYMEVLTNVVMLPGEALVRAITDIWNTDFGLTKIIFDSSITITACILSFVLANHLDGIREGTIIAAVLVGFVARFFNRALSFLPDRLLSTEKKLSQ